MRRSRHDGSTVLPLAKRVLARCKCFLSLWRGRTQRPLRARAGIPRAPTGAPDWRREPRPGERECSLRKFRAGSARSCMGIWGGQGRLAPTCRRANLKFELRGRGTGGWRRTGNPRLAAWLARGTCGNWGARLRSPGELRRGWPANLRFRPGATLRRRGRRQAAGGAAAEQVLGNRR